MKSEPNSLQVATYPQEFEEFLISIINNVADPIFVKDAEHRWIILNDAFCNFMGHPREALIGKSDHDFFPAEEAKIFWAKDEEVFKKGGMNFNEESFTDSEGRVHIIQTKKTVFINQKDALILVGVIRDVTELRETQSELENSHLELEKRVQERTTELKTANEKLNVMANIDTLTGLANRLSFNKSIKKAIERISTQKNRHLALLFLDFDNFKHVNDHFGHPTGDLMISRAAERLRTQINDLDLLARLGGDEFVILHECQHANEAAEKAKQILSVFDTLFELGEHKISASACIGISMYPEDADNETTLQKHADSALYRAKKQGTGNYEFYTQELAEQAGEYLEIQSGLKRALDTDEIYVVYQPIYDAQTREIVGVEALARWRSPELGEVTPGRFIPIAEDSGLIHRIGEKILSIACHQYKRWRDDGHKGFRLFVNISIAQLRHAEFIDQVKHILKQTGLPARALTLEITESMAMAENSKEEQKLRDLQQLGVFLAIDDFGTGYSSFAILERLPIDIVKIDRSFVQGLPDNESSLAIVQAILAMAITLKYDIIAEGVEESEQQQFLASLGCNSLQGFSLARPALPAVIDEMLRSQAI